MEGQPASAVTRAAGRESLADQAYAEVRDRIVSLRMPPRSAINEDSLMAELGVGRTPVREAIKRLALESLVDVYPRRGTFVSEIQITDLAMISEVRERLESYAAELAAQRLRPEDVPELESLLERIETGSTEATDALMDLDASVHRFIYRTARNRYLRDTLERYFNLAARIWYLALDRVPSMQANVSQHRDLLIAIRDHDEGRARTVAANHVSEFAAAMREVL